MNSKHFLAQGHNVFFSCPKETKTLGQIPKGKIKHNSVFLSLSCAQFSFLSQLPELTLHPNNVIDNVPILHRFMGL